MKTIQVCYNGEITFICSLMTDADINQERHSLIQQVKHNNALVSFKRQCAISSNDG